MTNYPPGVSAGTPDAPWNQTPAPACEHCDGCYKHGGHVPLDDGTWCHECDGEWGVSHARCPNCGSENVTGLPCPDVGVDRPEYEERQRGRRGDRAYERQRLDGT